jgi:hypothetical protein
MIQGHSRKPLEAAVDEVIVVAHSADGGIWMKSGFDRVLVRGRLGAKGAEKEERRNPAEKALRTSSAGQPLGRGGAAV